MAHAERKNSIKDYLILALALVAVSAGVYGYYFFQEQSVFYATASMIAAIILALALVYWTAVGQLAWGYMRASRTELRKVVWPTRQETLQTLLMVAIVVGILSLYLWLCDLVTGWGVEHLLI